jgi:NADPH:quinone reductase-like Zn-dependent oxidoreductase
MYPTSFIMKATYYEAYGPIDVLLTGELPDPVPEKGEVLVRVKAASLNPVDSKIRQGQLKMLSGSRFPKIPGSDFAGIVESTGPGVASFSPCDKVYGFVNTLLGKPGCLAEFVVAPVENLRILPEGMAFEEAASLPVAALTALNGLRKGDPVQGKSVLVNGATGGVGHFALQIAHIKGARITAICSTANREMAIKLGAAEVIDYKTARLDQEDRKFDLILDAWGKMDKKTALHLLSDKGVYASTQANPLAAYFSFFSRLLRGKTMTAANMRAKPEDYEELELFFRQRKLTPLVEKTFDLNQVREAFLHTEQGKHRGKIVVRI